MSEDELIQGKCHESTEEGSSGRPCMQEWKVKVLVALSCPTLCDPRDCSPPGSSVLGILQARILYIWVAIPFSRVSSQLRDRTWVSHIVGKFFTIWATREAHVRVRETMKHGRDKHRERDREAELPCLTYCSK